MVWPLEEYHLADAFLAGLAHRDSDLAKLTKALDVAKAAIETVINTNIFSSVSSKREILKALKEIEMLEEK